MNEITTQSVEWSQSLHQKVYYIVKKWLPEKYSIKEAFTQHVEQMQASYQ